MYLDTKLYHKTLICTVTATYDFKETRNNCVSLMFLFIFCMFDAWTQVYHVHKHLNECG